MSIDAHPYFFIYFVGCALAIISSLINLIVFRIIWWITKENILNKNLKKMKPPDETTFVKKSLIFVGSLFLDALFSWISVVIAFWQFIKMFLTVIREALTVKPESVKSLRFPLWNNPNMSREAVWAYLTALQVKAGEKQPNESDLLYSMGELLEYYPSFNRRNAMGQLKDLNVIENDIVSSVFNRLDDFDEWE